MLLKVIVVDTPRAWKAHNAHIGRIFNAAGSGQVCACISTPVANIRYDFGSNVFSILAQELQYFRINLFVAVALQVDRFGFAECNARSASWHNPGFTRATDPDDFTVARFNLFALDCMIGHPFHT